MYLAACNKQVDKGFSGEWIQVPETESSTRKLFIEKSGKDYQIKDQFWLNKDSTRPSTSSEAIAEVASDGSLKYKKLNTIEFQMNTTSDQLTLHDKNYDAKVTFEKVN